MTIRAGRQFNFVQLSRSPQTTPDSDGFFEPLSPPGWWCDIQPLPPGFSDGTRTQMATIIGRFHPDITIDTRILEQDGTQWFVKGVQNVDNLDVELQLLCEQVIA